MTQHSIQFTNQDTGRIDLEILSRCEDDPAFPLTIECPRRDYALALNLNEIYQLIAFLDKNFPDRRQPNGD